MQVESGLLAYAALAVLSTARPRHRSAPRLPLVLTPTAARAICALLLALSAWIATLRFGASVGPVAWTGQLCVAGALFVLLSSWHPRVAVVIAIPALCAACF